MRISGMNSGRESCVSWEIVSTDDGCVASVPCTRLPPCGRGLTAYSQQPCRAGTGVLPTLHKILKPRGHLGKWWSKTAQSDFTVHVISHLPPQVHPRQWVRGPRIVFFPRESMGYPFSWGTHYKPNSNASLTGLESTAVAHPSS